MPTPTPKLRTANDELRTASGQSRTINSPLAILHSLLLLILLAPALRAAPCVAPPADIAAWWTGQGSAIEVTAGRHGFLGGAVLFTNAQVGQGFMFIDNPNSYVALPASPAWMPTNNQLTIECWIKPNFTVTGDKLDTIIAKRDGCSTLSYHFGLYKGHQGKTGPLYFGSSAGGGDSTNTVPNDGQFHHVAVTFDGSKSNANIRFYIDGQPAGTLNSPQTLPVTSESPVLGRHASCNYYSSAVMDEITLYHRELTASEIQSIVTAGTSGKCAPSLPAAAVPYFTDFENGAGPGWSATQTDAAESGRYTRFLGRFAGNNGASLTVTGLTAGTSYALAFDFYPIDSWDGGNTNTGDQLIVTADAATLLRDTFSNYNGNPPNVPQTYPRPPDEGRANLGYVSSYLDTIYRHIELNFTATNPLALLTFRSLNLSDVSDESWGIDNIRIRPAADTTATIIHSTTLPAPNTTNALAVDQFTAAASRPLQATSATNAANWLLREAGPNGTLGNSDDLTIPLTPALIPFNNTARAITLTPAAANAPLPPGRYRLTTGPGLLDTNGAAVAPYTHDFTIIHPTPGRIETPGSDAIATATDLTPVETPAATGYLTAHGIGTYSAPGEIDYWRFDAETGDIVTIRLETQGEGTNPQLQLQNVSGQNLQTVNGTAAGIATIQRYAFAAPGTYYLRTWSDQRAVPYQLRLDLGRATQLEAEPNDTPATANLAALSPTPGLAQGRVAGTHQAGPDHYALLTLNPGNAITVTARFPDGSTANAANLVLQLLADTNTVAANTGATLNHTIQTTAQYFLRASSTNTTLRSQYLLDITISDAVPPAVTATTLPAAAVVTNLVLDRFTVTYTEDMNPAALTNSANYEARGAGPDNIFGTPDDTLYRVQPDPYASGLTAGYLIIDGPFQPGQIRLTLRTNLTDRLGNPLATAFTRTFTIANPPNYTLETRNNDTWGNATPVTVSGNPFAITNGGTIAWDSDLPGLATPQYLTSGHFNGDTNLDLAIPYSNAGILAIATNNGAGRFQVMTNIPVGNDPVAVVTGRFNNDNLPDLAVTRQNPSIVTILVAVPGGGYTITTNIAGIPSPYQPAAADLNADGYTDLAVPRVNGGTIAVLIANGNGTFQPATNYTVNANAYQVAAGQLNNDTFPDLAVACTSGHLAILFGNGNGTFQPATNYVTGPNTRSVAIADVNGDGTNDLAVLASGDNTVNILRGLGNGTYAPRVDYPAGSTDNYQLTLGDFTGDGRPEILVPGYGGWTLQLLQNNGTGQYTNQFNYSLTSYPLGAALGDYNNDGRLDAAITRYTANLVSIYLGTATAPWPEDPPASGLRTALVRGNLTTDTDADYYQFTGTAGEQLIVAIETPGALGSSGLHVEIYRAEGTALHTYNANINGWGQSAVLTLPYTGTYFVRVTENYSYRGEYRLRITRLAPGSAFETEANDTIATADYPPFAQTNNHLIGTIAGYASYGDAAGDYYDLGWLEAGANVVLALQQPATGGFNPIVAIFNAAGQLQTNSPSGATNITFNVRPGADGYYYARVVTDPLGPAPLFSGQPGNALYFNGTDQYVRVPDSPSLRPVNLTLEGWVNFSSIFSSHVFFAKGLGAADDDSYALWYYQGRLRAYVSGSPEIGFNWAPDIGRWYHVAYTFDDAANTQNLYLDGVLVGTSTASGSISYDTRPFHIGSDVTSGVAQWFFAGKIDEVRLWNIVRASNEIAAARSQRLVGNEAGLAGYWRLDEGTGVTTADATANANHGGLSNAPVWAASSLLANTASPLASQYLLKVDITEPSPLRVISTTLPGEGGVVSNIWQSFTVQFNEELDPRINGVNRAVFSSGASRYAATDSAVGWAEAETLAVAAGGHLVTVDDAAENAFLRSTFTGIGDVWIGLNDRVVEGTFAWAGGASVTYTNWQNGQPDNDGSADGAVLDDATGQWYDDYTGTARRGIIEVPAAAPDGDGDGVPNGLDVFAADRLNGFDLRAAGADTLFDTPDDEVYRLVVSPYSRGTNVSLIVTNGPLQAGSYRFTVTAGVRDRFGNGLAASFVRKFTVGSLPGFVLENRTNDTTAGSTVFGGGVVSGADGTFRYGTNFASGSNPYFVVATNLNGDGFLDLLVANYGADSLSVFLGLGNGGFQLLTNVPVGNGPIGFGVADFNADGLLDVAVALYQGNRLGILLGAGGGHFSVATNYVTPSQPYYLVTGDFNGDGKVDVVTANLSGNNVSVFAGVGNGTFLARSDFAAGAGAYSIAAGDLNGDGFLDVVTANRNASSLSVLLGTGTGGFLAPTNYGLTTTAGGLAIRDFNGDGLLDVVAMSGDDLNFFAGRGDGSLGARVSVAIGASDVYQIMPLDVDGNGTLDVVVPSYGNSRLLTVMNAGGGVFGGVLSYVYTGNPIGVAAGDFNADGRLDLVTANYSSGRLQVLLGVGGAQLVEDAGTGLRSAAGRGALVDANDADYWSFRARANDRVVIAVESVGAVAGSQLRYILYRPDGVQLTDLYADNNGRGEINAVLGAPGLYGLRVERYDAYAGEYRFRITLAQPPAQYETEANDTLATADPVTLTLSAGRQTADVFGYFGVTDTGDYFRLGNLSEGTEIGLRTARPATSPVTPVVGVYNASDVQVARSLPGQTNLAYLIPPGQSGAYYARALPTWPVPPVGGTNGLRFDGGDDSVRVGNWSPGSKWSVQAWALPMSRPAGRHTIAGAMGGCLDWGVALVDGKFAAIFRQGGCAASIVAPDFAELGRWAHVAATCDGTNAQLYVNGVLIGAAPVDLNFVPYTGGTWIGGEVCCGNYFHGLIGPVSIWSRTLSGGEIAGGLNSFVLGSEPGLAGAWRLNEGSGTTVADLSPLARTGTLFNGALWVSLWPGNSGSPGVLAEYTLDIELRDTAPPFVVDVSLPAEGAASSAIIDRFTVTFSEDMAPASVASPGSYLLRGAGPNGVFDAVDDSFYALTNSPNYANGLSALLNVLDGPLQAGLYRFTALTNLTDSSGTAVASNYVRQFMLTNTGGFVFENRSNDVWTAATALGAIGSSNVGGFSPGMVLPVGLNPEYTLLARLNGDAFPDLLVANYGASTLSVYLGAADGSFTLKTNWAGGAGGLQPVFGNFNGDAFPDLAVGNYTAGTISIYRGVGDGSFAAITNYPTGGQTVGIVTGDWNNDGRADLATANYQAGTLSVLLGAGNGTFQSVTNYPGLSNPYQLAAADLNGDGRMDLAVANAGADNVLLYFGNGNGTFTLAQSLPAGDAPYAIVATDLDADGKVDLAAGCNDGALILYPGNGDGSFQPRRTLNLGVSPIYHLIASDLNADGRPDLALTGFNQDRLVLLFQTGPFTFQPAAHYTTGDGPVGITVGDVNADTRPDLIVANYAAHTLSLFLNRGAEQLPSDAPGTNGPALTLGLGRGNLQSNADNDYWSFTAAAGDRVQIVIENPGDGNATGRCFDLYGPGGLTVDSWCADYYGRAQWSGTLAAAGPYYLRIRYNYSYTGEYRLRVSLIKPPVQVEVEANDSPGQASAPVFAQTPGLLSATIFGTVHSDDTGGDYYRLGQLAPGAYLQLALARPASSTLTNQIALYKGTTLVTNSPVGATNLLYSVPAGAGDLYYARVTAAGGTAGLLATYLLTIQIYDGEPPAVLATTLPANATTSTALLDRFTITVSEDLDPAPLARLTRRPLRYQGHAYLRTIVSDSWPAAETEALTLGGHLATINNPAENQWLLDTFGGGHWIGLTDENVEGTWQWANGEPVAYLNWTPGEPNNSGNEDHAVLLASGLWNDESLGGNHPGLIEVTGPDTDADGLPDTVDAYPADPLNLIDLRATGPDQAFDTPDDETYTLALSAYTGGTALNLTVLDGPLQAGQYRLRVTTGLRDRQGNTPLAPYDQVFTIAPVPPFTVENRNNNAGPNATLLPLDDSPSGLRTGLARGKLFDGGDADYWSFNANSNDVLTLSTEVPGAPGASGLRYRLLNPAGATLLDLYAEYYGDGQAGPLLLTNSGTYRLLVTANYTYLSEHRFRVTLMAPPIQVESEANNTLATADPLTLQTNAGSRTASVAGVEDAAGDLDYFALGQFTNGTTVFLNVRLPNTTTFAPVVALYNASGQYQNEVTGGRAGDGIAEVQILATGNYFALVRGGGGTVPGLRAQYLLDLQAVPTGTVSFPNLQVTSLTLPGGAPVSGQTVSYSYTVANIGQLATPGASWVDRAVFSTNTTLGDADDLPLGFAPHFGVLAPGAGYGVSNTYVLPQGLSGDFYLIVQTDAGNAINEFIFETDNTTVSASTFHVNRAPYPDLRVENLALTGPAAGGVYTITWTTANRGDASAPAGFRDRYVVRNLNTAQTLTSVDLTAAAPLAINGTLARQQTLTTTNPGTYQIQITTDALDDIYEFDAISHASAELNTATTNFTITQFFTVNVAASPTNAGAATGGGTFASGASVSLNAVANTNTLPWYFLNWTENGIFQSASAQYTFTLTRARDLVANFTLPAYAITVSNNPPQAGSATGGGTYFHGTTNVLTATANFGYRFVNWTENGQLVSLLASLTNVATSNRFLVANYTEANTFHVVSTATSPTNLAPVLGAGVYTNGQLATISAPASITNPPSRYTFREYRLNGALVGTSPSFQKTFSTLDTTNLQYIAIYDVSSLLPVIVSAYGGITNPVLGGFTLVTNPVPATTRYQITVQFDRPMDAAVNPLILISNTAATVQPTVPAGGDWFASAQNNDTYRSPYITLSNGMDGVALVRVLNARDPQGLVMTPTNLLALLIDVTPPPAPVLSLTASNNTSATVSWSGYAPPADLNSFRVYLAPTNFTTVAGLTPLTTLAGAARSHTYGGLALDTPYYAAIVAVDAAGNSRDAVTALPFNLPRTVPPPVAIQVTATDPTSAAISWSGYSTANLLGFAGFWLYYETNNFSTIAGLTPKQTLGAGVRSADVAGLDRLRTYYFAVVGYNSTNGRNPLVSTKLWTDPFAGQITANLTIGGAGQTVDILQPMIVVSNAVLTLQPGSTLRFASGAGINVQQGRLNANGTALDPIVLTSLNEQPGQTPNAGDWSGVMLGSGAGASVLRHVWVKFGAGLTLSNCAPTVDAFTALNNTPAGLSLLGNATLNTAAALLAFNDVGAQQSGTAQLIVRDSVLKNNPTNALAAAGTSLVATQNWWGSASASEIDAALRGPVNRASFLTGEPLLTPAIGTSNNISQTGLRSVGLRLACRTADSMRLSEDSAFFAAFYQPFAPQAAFQLSEGGGLKTIFAQFRSVTGQTSAPVSVSVNFITAGPAITAFSLAEGQVLGRPLTVSGVASAALGVSGMELFADNVLVGTNAGSPLAVRLDVRSLSNGVHRMKLLARDTSGNIASRELNVTVVVQPPPAPAIVSPATDLIVSSNSVNVRGTAEPLVSVRLVQNSTPVATATADAGGQWAFSNVALLEGNNVLAVSAFDGVGSASSAGRTVVRDSGPPGALVLDGPSYTPVDGLGLTWSYPTNGERAAFFRVLWHTNVFVAAGQASGQSALLSVLNYRFAPGSSVLVPGPYFFGVVGYDNAGNVSALSNVRSFVYDPVPPSFSVSFDKSSPVGLGLLRITLVASEALFGQPSLTLVPQGSGSAPVSLSLSNSALNTYVGILNVTPSAPSGGVGFQVAGRDLSGNVFNGAPSGPGLVIDVLPPSARIVTAPAAPVQATNAVVVSVAVTLSESARVGSTPTLSFTPPVGPQVPIVLSGAGSNWVGSLEVVPGMGSGNGTFGFSAVDERENVGQLITSGRSLEIYNTALPRPPGQPVNFHAQSLSGGRVQLSWSAVSNAEVYRVYAQAGSNVFLTPTNLIADNVVSNSFIDLPGADGSYLYVVSALRRGSEGTNSITRLAVSDRTPPPAPTNVSVLLLSSGVRVSWRAGAGEEAASYKVYRNGAAIRSSVTSTSIVDSPPRGVMSYAVAAVDGLGNEALSGSASIELLVGAVNNLVALSSAAGGGVGAPLLTWSSSDVTAVGFNVYRNGVKQNAAPLSGAQFSDALGVPAGGSVRYAVRAVNATNAESAPREVVLFDVGLDLFGNLLGGVEQPRVNFYFDSFLTVVTNRTVLGTDPFVVDFIQLRRSVAGQASVVRSNVVDGPVAAGAVLERNIVVPGGSVTDPQSYLVRVYQEPDAGGSYAIYEAGFGSAEVVQPASMVEVSAAQQPLAGGLATIEVLVWNRGFADMDVLVARDSGAAPGDVAVSVKDSFGVVVSRVDFAGVPSGSFFLPDGRVFVRVPPGGSKALSVPGVLVPEALGTNVARFEAVVDKVYYRLGSADEALSGPLSGSMVSSLAVTPYYGVARTDRRLYANEDAIVISGEAIDRQSGQPKPNVSLKLGFSVAGAKFFLSVTSDALGGFTYTYQPPQGMSGSLKIWAAHPAVFDTLNQAEVKLYRCYLSPANVDLRMSKNGKQRFFLTVINTGDETLSGFSLDSAAYTYIETDRVPIDTVAAAGLFDTNFVVGPRSTERVSFELEAAIDAPDRAVIDFELRSAEGATARFHANLTLLEAQPLLVVTEPGVGYVEASVNRGELRSRSVTLVNRGLRPLQGVTLRPPTNINWISVNLPKNSNGVIELPDLPVGSTNSFTVVFAPPADAALDLFQDRLRISGTNSPAVFDVPVYGLVTSSLKGAVRFFADNILVEPVPNATVRIKNTLLEQEYSVRTDANGFVTIPDLQEGPWAWQVTAPGHSAQVGVVEVIPDQTVLVETRLSRALVTVNFSVVPVPYTDRYEITIEQVFETHVPAPVLVLTPPHMDFNNVTPGYEATYIMTAKNHGLIQMTDVTFRGMRDGNGGVLTPLINYVPILRAQESVEIPMRFTFNPTVTSTNQGGGGSLARTYGERRKNLTRDIDENGNITGGVQFPPSFSDNASPGQSFADCATGGLGSLADLVGGLMAIANACATCADLRTAMAIAASAAVTYSLLCAPTFSPLGLLPSPCPSGGPIGWVISFFINLASCACQALGCFGSDGGGGSGPGGGGGPQGFGQYAPSGPGCFVEGTMVSLADGTLKPIERVQVGDRVKTGVTSREVALVREVESREVADLWQIEFAGESGADLLRSSAEHEFWVDGKGWTAARNLRSGDWLMNDAGSRIQIARMRRVPGAVKVYTFVNSGDHAFYANRVLVRDSCGNNGDRLRPASTSAPPNLDASGKEVAR